MPKQLLENAKQLTLTHFDIWDLLREKAFQKVPIATLDSNQDEIRKMKLVTFLTEFLVLLRNLGELLDKCLVPTDSPESGLALDPALSKALGKDPGDVWTLRSDPFFDVELESKSILETDDFDADDVEEHENDLLQISYLPLKFDVEFVTDGHDQNLEDILDVDEEEFHFKKDEQAEVTEEETEPNQSKSADSSDEVSHGQTEESSNQVSDKDKIVVEQHECPHCSRSYKNPRNLNRHQKTCNGVPPPAVKPSWFKSPTDGRYHCSFPGCSSRKTWTCSSGVWKHFNSEHADLKDESYCVYPCDLCDKRFPTKTMFNQHRKHKHVNCFKFSCNVCGKLLPSNERLRLHVRQHTGEKPFSCDLCNYKSITQSGVNQHKNRMHEAVSGVVLPRHVCDICGKTFKVKSNLKEHIKSHSDVRTFLCGFCGKALKNRQCLNRHLFTHGVKFTCSCGKNFTNQTSLNVHKRDKHGIKV